MLFSTKLALFAGAVLVTALAIEAQCAAKCDAAPNIFIDNLASVPTNLQGNPTR
jgi:hypothetical protein